ncbi:rhomboid family intramembrane serine protease [Breznakiella homolactica]|uniref:Rhomboid family intramembrane serine protease n=1 Tax=Breznakiella homolactica TaxID=2798577 RepID=A0A7T8BC21_9SPIR|nr:rhomboid family intramembrane serine protease [Breznakiella homolactica]QQO09783.1 rhomboid family intramembrane serine protease [Breznakiella homolactica]
MKLLRRPFRYRYDNVVIYLIGINILVFLAQQVFRDRHVTFYLALNPVAILNGWVWQFVTYMFTHGGISHILFNMLALFIFGRHVERQMGSKEFLLFYFSTGILAGVFSFVVYLVTGSYGIFLMGASGAVFAVQLAYAVFFPDSIIYIWGILPLRAPVMVLVFTVLELIFSITGLQSGVAHLTHLAGFAFAWLYFLIRFGANPWNSLVGRR